MMDLLARKYDDLARRAVIPRPTKSEIDSRESDRSIALIITQYPRDAPRIRGCACAERQEVAHVYESLPAVDFCSGHAQAAFPRIV